MHMYILFINVCIIYLGKHKTFINIYMHEIKKLNAMHKNGVILHHTKPSLNKWTYIRADSTLTITRILVNVAYDM